MKLKTISESINEADDATPLSVDLPPAKFNTVLKKMLKNLGVAVKSIRIVNSYNWPKCYVQVYGDIPNNVRRAVLEAMYPGLKYKDVKSGEMKDLGVKNLDDIHYGNITSNQVSAHAQNWVDAMASLTSGE